MNNLFTELRFLSDVLLHNRDRKKMYLYSDLYLCFFNLPCVQHFLNTYDIIHNICEGVIHTYNIFPCSVRLPVASLVPDMLSQSQDVPPTSSLLN